MEHRSEEEKVQEISEDASDMPEREDEESSSSNSKTTLNPVQIALLNAIQKGMEKEKTTAAHKAFLRSSKKSKSTKVYNMPSMEEGEELIAYFDRCKKETGARPAPIGPMKKIKPNAPCPCGSGQKFKKCCERKS